MEDQIIAALRRIIRAIDLHSRWLRDHFGLTGPQLATLREAARLKGAPSGILAKAVHLSQPTLTGILDRLERQGLVARVRNGADRRSVTVEVTEQGESILHQAPSLLQDRFANELGKLAEWERTMMLATLQRIAAMMDAGEMDVAPVLLMGEEPTMDRTGPSEQEPPQRPLTLVGSDGQRKKTQESDGERGVES